MFSRSYGVVAPHLPPELFGEGGEGEQVGAGGIEVPGHGWQRPGHGVDQLVELGVDAVGVGLVVDRVQHRLHPAPGGLRADTVLITAAAGRIGSLLVQSAKSAGATVIGAASRQKLAAVTGFGADHAVDYGAVGWASFSHDRPSSFFITNGPEPRPAAGAA